MPPSTRFDIRNLGDQWFGWITPNQLTLGRIGSIPVLMFLVYLDTPVSSILALLLFILAGLTDYVDGVLARHRNEVTLLGRMLDPIADKMLVSASLIMLVATGHAATVPTILIILREFAVSGLRQVAALDNIEIHVVGGAKWKTGFQMTATGMLLLSFDPFGIPMRLLGNLTLWAAMAVTVYTGYGYFAAFFRNQDHAPPPAGD